MIFTPYGGFEAGKAANPKDESQSVRARRECRTGNQTKDIAYHELSEQE